MKKLQFLLTILSACIWTASASAASAQMSEEEAQTARELRLSVFELMSYNMRPIAGMARRTVPFDAVLAERNARRVIELSKMITEVFIPDTRGVMIYSRAKDFIWDNVDTFTEHANDLTRAATALAEAAATGEQSALRAAMRQTGPACGACHDLFRFQESDPAMPVPKPD